MSSETGRSLECVPNRPSVVSFDVSTITDLDESVLEALARIILAARRMGVSVELRRASRDLVDLLTLAGLAGELGLEVRGEAEAREQRGVDEEIDAGDEAV